MCVDVDRLGPDDGGRGPARWPRTLSAYTNARSQLIARTNLRDLRCGFILYVILTLIQLDVLRFMFYKCACYFYFYLCIALLYIF